MKASGRFGNVALTLTGMDCLNCGATMGGPYCASCGQKQPHPDLTLRELVHEATEELAHWDGKVPATLKTLFLKLGQLTMDFLAGRRRGGCRRCGCI
jgi:hypothetical protein